MSDVVVIGGGVIGRATAFRIASQQAGSVRVIERQSAPRGASVAAAGMAAAQAESILHPAGHSLDFLVRARKRLFELTTELESISRHRVEWWHQGILLVADDDPHTRRMGDAALRQQEQGLRAEIVTPLTLLEIEPGLSPSLAGGVYLPDDRALHTTQYLEALEASLTRYGVHVDRDVEAHHIEFTGDRVTGVSTSRGRLHADAVVLCGGAWSPEVAATVGIDLPIRPIRGQILEIGARSNAPIHIVYSPKVYFVPRSDSVLVGATMEDVGFDESVTFKAMTELGTHAGRIHPQLLDRPLRAVRSGLRPVSADGAPYIGQLPGVSGLILATGHGRNGILTSAITADLVAMAIAGRGLPVWASHVDAARAVPSSQRER
jgi:glycine oxidase